MPQCDCFAYTFVFSIVDHSLFLPINIYEGTMCQSFGKICIWIHRHLFPLSQSLHLPPHLLYNKCISTYRFAGILRCERESSSLLYIVGCWSLFKILLNCLSLLFLYLYLPINYDHCQPAVYLLGKMCFRNRFCFRF